MWSMSDDDSHPSKNATKKYVKKTPYIIMADHAPVTLVEKWDIPMLNRLVRAAAGVSPHSALLLQALARLNKATGELRVTYKHAAGTPFGRRYGYPSLQSTPGWVRRLCYHDVDIENCFPVILEQVARRHNLNCPLFVDSRRPGVIIHIPLGLRTPIGPSADTSAGLGG